MCEDQKINMQKERCKHGEQNENVSSQYMYGYDFTVVVEEYLGQKCSYAYADYPRKTGRKFFAIYRTCMRTVCRCRIVKCKQL